VPFGNQVPKVLRRNERLVGEHQQNGVRGRTDGSNAGPQGTRNSVRVFAIDDQVPTKWRAGSSDSLPVHACYKHASNAADGLGVTNCPRYKRCTVNLRKLFGSAEAAGLPRGKDDGE
jgi:hypothetical protein